jgi:multiple sugar transport system permease protein
MKRRSRYIFNPVLWVLGFFCIFPLVVTFTNSFMTESEILCNYTSKLNLFDMLDGITEKYVRMSVIPRMFCLDQYAQTLVYQPAFLHLLLNSLKITLPVTLGNLVISLPAAYGFTRCPRKIGDILFALYTAVMLLPLQAVLAPNYIIADLLHLKDSYLAIILPGIFSPFGVFLLRQNLKTFPAPYFEAAEIDGAGHGYILLFILIPQLKSSIAALFMLTFIEYWNMVEQAVVFITDYTREPLSVYLSRLSDGRIALVFAASCIYMLPCLWFLSAGRENLEKGIELSGLR